MTERLADGTAFGSYIVEGLIAAGGMGQVYAARHAIYGSAVALKVLHPALHSDEGWRARFNEEGLVGTQLKHPHVLSAREVVENESRIAIVVDLVQGGQTLEKVMSREFRDGIAVVPALRVFLRILQGMDYLHGKGIVHGDLKPENVMIEGDFRRPETWIPKVTDFGTVALIAHPVEIDGRPAVVATPRYASPEHLYGVDRIEVRSDVYCLGLILHFLLSGRHASNAQNVREAAERVMLPVPIVNLVDQPEPLVTVFKTCTAARAEDRYPTVRAIALAIRSVLEEVGAAIELADVAADLATEVDEDRQAKQKSARPPPTDTGNDANASQAATEPLGPQTPRDSGASRQPAGPPKAVVEGPHPKAAAKPADKPASVAPKPPAPPSPTAGPSQGASSGPPIAVTRWSAEPESTNLSPDDVQEPVRRPTPPPLQGRTRAPPAPAPGGAAPWMVLGIAGLVGVVLIGLVLFILAS